MSNFVYTFSKALDRRHYVQQSSAADYFSNFYYKELNTYAKRYGERFCLVVFRPGSNEDCYVLPYRMIRPHLEKCYGRHKNRWVCRVNSDVLRLYGIVNLDIPVKDYHNAIHLLIEEEIEDLDAEKRSPVVTDSGVAPDLLHLQQLINAFNSCYEEALPTKRFAISEQIARPGPISDLLKRLHEYKCQICGQDGFSQKNGNKYAEAHHITELHRLIPGSYCSDNILVVCANCHRKLHFASLKYSFMFPESIGVELNGAPFVCKRNKISETP